MPPILIGMAPIYQDDNGDTYVDNENILGGDDAEEVMDHFGMSEKAEDGDSESPELGKLPWSKSGQRKQQDNRKTQGGQGMLLPTGTKAPTAPGKQWMACPLSERQDLEGAGVATLRFRLQHDYRASDITLEGSHSSARLILIAFGDEIVFTQEAGIPATVFSRESNIRGMLKGRGARAGLDIIIKGTLDAAGTFSATLLGEKPRPAAC